MLRKSVNYQRNEFLHLKVIGKLGMQYITCPRIFDDRCSSPGQLLQISHDLHCNINFNTKKHESNASITEATADPQRRLTIDNDKPRKEKKAAEKKGKENQAYD